MQPINSTQPYLTPKLACCYISHRYIPNATDPYEEEPSKFPLDHATKHYPLAALQNSLCNKSHPIDLNPPDLVSISLFVPRLF